MTTYIIYHKLKLTYMLNYILIIVLILGIGKHVQSTWSGTMFITTNVRSLQMSRVLYN